MNNDSIPRKTYFDNYYAKNDTILSTEKLILASSSKRGIITVEPPTYDFSTLETGRLKTSNSKIDTQLKSCTSIVPIDETKHTIIGKRRILPNTPMGNKNKSSHTFKKMLSSYSSKMEKRNSDNFVPWSLNVNTLPKQMNRYAKANSKKMLARAYKSIPKDIILNKRNGSSRRINHSRRNKIPPSFKDQNEKEDHTLCLLLKHLPNNGPASKLPKVTSHTGLRNSTNFMESRKNLRKKVRIEKWCL